MFHFSPFFLYVVIFWFLLIFLGLVYLWLTKSKDKLKKLGFFIISFTFFNIILVISQDFIFNNFKDQGIILIFEIENIIITFLFSLLYFTILNNFQSKYIIYIYSTLILLCFHFLTAGIFGLIIFGTIIIALLSIINFALIIPYDDEYKTVIGLLVISLFFYVIWAIEETILGIALFLSIFFLISLSNESVRMRLISLYQRIIINIKNLGIIHWTLNFRAINNKSSPPSFYQAKVKITQGAIKEPQQEKNKKEKEETTWLQDFFSDRTRFGLELISHNDFRWAFFIKAQKKEKTKILGEALLTHLISIYPGLDGEVEVVPISKSEIFKNNYFWEIKLPKYPYLEKITIIRDFINVFHRNKQEIRLYILWKKATPKKIVKIREKIEQMKFKDDKEKENYLETWRDELFKVRIFVNYHIFEKESEKREIEFQLIEGRLKSLTMSGKNLLKGALLKKVGSGTLGNILRANLFSGRYVTPKCVDFDIQDIMPLFKPLVLEYENVEFSPIEEDDPEYVLIGRYLEKGRHTERKMLVHKKAFAQSALVVGQQGTGKTFLLAQIIQEFYNKCPDIGVLILNLGKGNQEAFYNLDSVIKFGDEELWVPYFHKGQYLERSLQETAAYLVAATGLKNIVEKNMINTMQAFLKKYGKLPNSIYTLFKNLIDYFKAHPYHDKFQTNILRALSNRVLSLLSNPVIQNTMNLRDKSDIPLWFNEWRNGKKIFLDISMCTVYEKRLITSALFQLVRELTPDIELGRLQNVIVIDEAHQILEKPITKNFDDDDFISREQLELLFNELLREFRSKGLAFILSDQTPSRLFDCVTTLPSLKIIFRVGYPCNKTMIGNVKEQELIILQKNRQALVLNGISGHKYLIETLDYTLSKNLGNHIQNKVHNCPYCKTPVDDKAELCSFCGKLFATELPEIRE